MKNDKIILAESIHKVIQGEGVNTNKKMLLLRTLGCPIKCENCDSRQTWDPKYINEKIKFSTKELAQELIVLTEINKVEHIMITGGEPHVYIDQIEELFKILMPKYYWKWDIETTGYKSWNKLKWYWNSIQFNFSPKIGSLYPDLPSLGFEYEWEGLYPINRPPHYNIKIVSSEQNWKNDLKDIKQFQKKYEIPDNRIILMPLGTERHEIISESQFLIEKAWIHGYGFSSRQHILIYNNLKKV